MTLEERTALTTQQIRAALDDYWKYVDVEESDECVRREDVSDAFIDRLARDSVRAKRDLRGLFRKSPAWNEELDALVINGNRTHDADADLVHTLVSEILRPAEVRMMDIRERVRLWSATHWFEKMAQGRDDPVNRASLEALAPGAYAPGKKPSRVLKALCVALGVVDETAGSEFQKKFARVADEMNGRKIDFKLFVSLNPAHFLTMSNPKFDTRGRVLTSCHSFNSTEYDYNNGCSGYARDKVSFIAFTVDNPDNAEGLNNRKISRQVFAYQPGNGVLLQSRMYKKCGGIHGEDPDSSLYRDLIQREICSLEDCINLWTTYSSAGEQCNWVETGCGFGGYADWQYSEFDGKICFRKDGKPKQPLTVGTYGLCIHCGEEICEGLSCDECEHSGMVQCWRCDEWFYEEDLHRARNRNGDDVLVCADCLADYYTMCGRCGEWVHDDCTHWYVCVAMCEDCYRESIGRCSVCGNAYWNEELRELGIDGASHRVCLQCAAKEEIRNAQSA